MRPSLSWLHSACSNTSQPWRAWRQVRRRSTQAEAPRLKFARDPDYMPTVGERVTVMLDPRASSATCVTPRALAGLHPQPAL
jgi:hypothetical protein